MRRRVDATFRFLFSLFAVAVWLHPRGHILPHFTWGTLRNDGNNIIFGTTE